MLSLSSKQYTLLRKIPAEFDVELARKYNQTTLGSFARRGYVVKRGTKFRLTVEGQEALATFGRAEIFRKLVSEKLSVHFREVLQMKKSA